MLHDKHVNALDSTSPQIIDIAITRDTACSDACSLLAMMMQLTTRELAWGIREGTVQEDIGAIAAEIGIDDSRLDKACSDLRAAASSLSDEDFFHEMRAEYTRLFSDPDQPAIWIYEALYLYEKTPEAQSGKRLLPRMFVNKAALDAERCYKKAGLERNPDVRIPADHLATELEFLAFAWKQRAIARIEGDEAGILSASSSLAEFDRLHVAKWFADFFASCEHEGRGVFVPIGIIGGILTTALRTAV